MKDKHRVSSRYLAREKLYLGKYLILAMGLMFLLLSVQVAKAEQPAIIDPCATFPPTFPSNAPDSFLQFLELQVPADLTTATAYYKAVDPFNRRLTLNDWLVVNGFIQNPGDLTAGPTGDALVARDAFAMYVNDVDLGVTRRFYSLTKSNGNVAIYTENYRCLSDAKLRQNLLATVAMEWSPADDGSNPKTKFITFYAYGPDNNRLLEINLDGRGNKALPDNCQICHGGNPKSLDANGNFPNHGNIGAYFLPWDIKAFIFDTDPALTRAAQEGQIKKLNQAAYSTYKKTLKYDEVGGYYRPNALTELVQGWYGGATLPNPTFNENFTPKGWLPPYAPPEAEALYHDVVVPTCRSCHISRESSLDFTSYKGFMVFKDSIENLVFNSVSNLESGGGGNEGGVMPLALKTFNNFWNTSAHDALRQFLDTH